jgi:hypothetical protein
MKDSTVVLIVVAIAGFVAYKFITKAASTVSTAANTINNAPTNALNAGEQALKDAWNWLSTLVTGQPPDPVDSDPTGTDNDTGLINSPPNLEDF